MMVLSWFNITNSICVFVFSEIIKNTRADSPDIKSLKEALKSIQDVLELMNEDRAKIEKQQEMFVIHKMIENCPVRFILHFNF